MPSMSLSREGSSMLFALLKDLAETPGLALTATRDSRLELPTLSVPTVDWITAPPNATNILWLESAIENADAVWPIAPETGGALESICNLVTRKGKVLLNTPAKGVRLAASKFLTTTRLEGSSIPVVPSERWQGQSAAPASFPFVIKPDDGVGCEDTWIISHARQWEEFRTHAPPNHWIIQPLLNGDSLSLCGLFSGGEAILLSVNRQHIQRQDNSFKLRGCAVNDIADERGIFCGLLQKIAAACPELWGYVGVDLIRNNQGLHVLEINPRLTSSYTGLRSALSLNPALLVIDLMHTRRLPMLAKRTINPIEVTW